MIYVENKKAHLDFAFFDSFDAGIELTGQEVKSVKERHGSLDGARVIVRGGEAFLIGSFIPAYQVANAGKSYDAHRVRKLLLTKKEIAHLYKDGEQKKLTMIPLTLYSKGLLIKCHFVLAKRKTKYDKREALKKESASHDMKSESFAWYDYE